MFLGHVAVGLAAKRAAPRTSMAVLLAAPMLADMIWPILLLTGTERAQIDPGNTAFTPIAFTHYPVTHSLVASIGWAVLAAALYFAFTRNRRGALVTGALVLSHWFFDLIVHRPDLPVVPGGGVYGFGLWNHVAVTIVLESALFIAGIAIYLSVTRARGVAGHASLWSFIVLMTLIYIANITSPPPPDIRAVAFLGLALWLFVPWGWWIERTRLLREVR